MIDLFIPGVPSNANRSGNWGRTHHAEVRERAYFRGLTAQVAMVGRVHWPDGKPPRRVVLEAWHVSPVKRRRDPLGLAERLKPIADGLVDAGLLIDDDEDHMVVLLAPSRYGPTAGIAVRLMEES